MFASTAAARRGRAISPRRVSAGGISLALRANCVNGEDGGVNNPFPHPYYGTLGTGEVTAHAGLAFLFADGSVQTINENVPIRNLAKFVTIDAGETASNNDY